MSATHKTNNQLAALSQLVTQTNTPMVSFTEQTNTIICFNEVYGDNTHERPTRFGVETSENDLNEKTEKENDEFERLSCCSYNSFRQDITKTSSKEPRVF